MLPILSLYSLIKNTFFHRVYDFLFNVHQGMKEDYIDTFSDNILLLSFWTKKKKH